MKRSTLYPSKKLRVTCYLTAHAMLILLASLKASPLLAKPRNYQVDIKRSQVEWEGAKVSGKHTGFVSVKSGRLRLKNKRLRGSFIIDMNSITCSDVRNPKYNQKLVDHLKSEDFFHSAKYPTAKLRILDARPQASQKNVAANAPQKYIVQAKITIRGVTRKIRFPAQIQFRQKPDQIHAKGLLKLDRTLFNVKYKSGKFFEGLGDKLIYDTFRITFHIVLQ